jgi:hypothetical protein
MKFHTGKSDMTDANPREVIGGNNPPSPIDAVTAPYDDYRAEAENWLDGTDITNEAQMLAVDKLRGDMRQWRLALEAGQQEQSAPLYKVYKDALAAWKPTIDDAKRIESGLVGIVDGFKRKLAAEKAEAARLADAIAREAADKARAAAMAVDATNIDAARTADAMLAEAEALQKAAKAAAKDKVKGMRTVTRYEVTDHGKLVNWINKHDKAALTAFIDEWARRNHNENQTADGLRVWTEQEAY